MAKLFFIGDSITAGCWDEKGGWANRLVGKVMKKSMEAELKKGPFYCMPYNLGIGGDTVPDVLRRLEREIQARTYEDRPDELIQIVFAIGVNDSVYLMDEKKNHYSDDEFQKNLLTLIELAKTFTDNILFIGLLPPDEELVNPSPWAPTKAYTVKDVKHFDRMIETICQQENIPFLPLFDRWMNMPDYKKYFIDGLHPNSEGHEKMAKEIGEFLFTEEFLAFHADHQ